MSNEDQFNDNMKSFFNPESYANANWFKNMQNVNFSDASKNFQYNAEVLNNNHQIMAEAAQNMMKKNMETFQNNAKEMANFGKNNTENPQDNMHYKCAKDIIDNSFHNMKLLVETMQMVTNNYLDSLQKNAKETVKEAKDNFDNFSKQ